MNESGYSKDWPAPTFLECSCYSSGHVIKWDLLDDPDWPELYASVFLIPYRNPFKRIWGAIRYIFGYKCRYGHWDCFLMRPEDIGRMRVLLDAYQEAVEEARRKDSE